MLYYTATAYCPHCECGYPCQLVAEVEPPADAVFTVRCPKDAGPLAVYFRSFEPCDPFTPTPGTLRYPLPAPPRKWWWQFWKR